MIKKLIWNKTTETKSIEEKEALLKALQTEQGDMEIDLDRIDEREQGAVTCYRSKLCLTKEESDSLSDEVLFDFSENKYIIRCSFFVNGRKNDFLGRNHTKRRNYGNNGRCNRKIPLYRY